MLLIYGEIQHKKNLFLQRLKLEGGSLGIYFLLIVYVSWLNLPC